MTKYVQDQDALIVKLTYRVEGMMDEELSHIYQENVHKYKRRSMASQSKLNVLKRSKFPLKE